MKKILVTGMSPNIGGVETFIMNYIRNLNTELLSFDFWCNNRKCAFQEEIIKHGGTVYHGYARSENPIQSQKDITRFFSQYAKKYDCIWSNKCMLNNIDDIKLAKKYGIPRRIVHSHSSSNMERGMKGFVQGMLHTINKEQIPSISTDFWACSNAAGRWFYPPNIMNSSKYRVIPNAIDTKKFRFDLTKRKRVRHELGLLDETVIGFVGRLQYQKNPVFMLKVFEAYHQKNPNSKLLVIGTGVLEADCKMFVQQNHLAESVSFLGVRNDVADLYQAMDAFLLPSRFEGLGIVTIEAQTSGLPCLVSDAVPKDAALTDCIQFLPLEKSPEAWADAIEKKIQECPRKDRQAEIVTAGYDIQNAAKKLEQLLLE